MSDQILDALNGPNPGVYHLHALDEAGEFLPLQRLLGIDNQSILYIGASITVAYRVGKLKKSILAAYRRIDPATYGDLEYTDPMTHQAGKKIMRVPSFVERFPAARLCLTVERYIGDFDGIDVDRNGHTMLESRLLSDYEQLYGEKPAFNG